MYLVGNNSSMQPTPLWSVRKTYISSRFVFINIVFSPCYLFLLWYTVLKCPALCLITIIAARFLRLYACLTCSSVHASSLHSLLAHHHLCYVDVYCVLSLFLFSYFCDMLHFFVTSFLACWKLLFWIHFIVIFTYFMLLLLLHAFTLIGHMTTWTISLVGHIYSLVPIAKYFVLFAFFGRPSCHSLIYIG